MPRGKTSGGKPPKRPIERYEHSDKKRINNPPVGLVTPETDPVAPTHKTYDYIPPVPSVKPRQQLDYDPHLDPQLVWAGKKEHSSFEVPTVSLHVHERIDPHTIIEAVRKRNGNGLPVQPSLFERREENPPLREAIDFYRHAHGWSNRMIAGDSLLVMNSLLEKEGMAGQVQMVYIDPPYGIRYGSNFQPFVNKREVKDGKDEDLTQEPEMVRAFRDTWELGIHSYLSYLRDRLLLGRDLLHESGSCFVQISQENLHLVRDLMDEVFGAQNCVAVIPFAKTAGQADKYLASVCDFIVWYARSLPQLKYRQLYMDKIPGLQGATKYDYVELATGERRRLSPEEQFDLGRLAPGSRVLSIDPLTSQEFRPDTTVSFEFNGQIFHPGEQSHWKTSVAGLRRLALLNRLIAQGNKLRYIRYLDDFPVFPLTNLWPDIGGIQSRTDPKVYVVQTSTTAIQRCVLMATDPGDLVFDPTCGSGTTAYVAEQWGRRWVTCDTSRVAITLAKQRLTTAVFDYYEFARSEEGIGSGFAYRKVPHVTLKSIANNPEIREGMIQEQISAALIKYAEPETLYDQPLLDRTKARVSGPFTVEAVPAPTVKSLDEIEAPPSPADASIARSGPTLRHSEWRGELLKTGLRGKGGLGGIHSVTQGGLTRTYNYDGLGRLTSEINPESGTTSYSYDTENRVVAVSGTNSASYAYDAFGKRVRATINSSPYDFIFDQAGRAIDEVTASSWVWGHPGGAQTITYTNSSTYFDHSDWLGTVRARSTISGGSAETCTSLPFGDALTCTGTDYSPLHYTSQPLDSESNLHHFLFRQLSTTQGRWTAADPSGLAATNLLDPQTWNRYAYVGNRLPTLVDLLGLVDINPGMLYAETGGGGGGFDCMIDGLNTSCQMAYSELQGGGAVQCPNNYCGIGTSTPYQCLDVACGYMSMEYVATHENEWGGVLYSNAEWATFLTNAREAQREALADAISSASDDPNVTWDYAYNNLAYKTTKGGNADFEWTGDPSDIGFIPGFDSSGCEWSCRFDSMPSIHFKDDMLHLDTANPSWGFGFGFFVHGFVDVLLGNINPSVPMSP